MEKWKEIESEEELVRLIREGDKEVMDFLFEKYKSRVRKKANALFLLGGDTDDLIQEGMIGLFKALRDYEFGKESSFRSFADLCISRQMYTAIEAAQRKKHSPLNSYISLNEESGEEDTLPIGEKLSGAGSQDPQELIIDRENLNNIYEKIQNSLSGMEFQVLTRHLEGENYHQIAETLGKSDKAIDNALQRIKKKVQELI